METSGLDAGQGYIDARRLRVISTVHLQVTRHLECNAGLLAKNGTVLPAADLEQIVARTAGFSGADMHNLCTAAVRAMCWCWCLTLVLHAAGFDRSSPC